jgi:TFIIF-interacting CTD phosphatase-like protein
LDISIVETIKEQTKDKMKKKTKKNLNINTSKLFESKIFLLGKQVRSDIGKKTLVLDLDETLVHSVFERETNPECTFSILFNNEYYLVSTQKRPYLDEFLEKMSQHYEIVFYTSAVEGYANNVIDYIDPNKYSSSRLFRDS